MSFQVLTPAGAVTFALQLRSHFVIDFLAPPPPMRLFQNVSQFFMSLLGPHGAYLMYVVTLEKQHGSHSLRFLGPPKWSFNMAAWQSFFVMSFLGTWTKRIGTKHIGDKTYRDKTYRPKTYRLQNESETKLSADKT
jgi:hypothetical protein